MSLRVLLTNDDGIEAAGLQALRRALREVDGVDLQVIAPDGNRSAVGRGITILRALTVRRVDFEDGSWGFATDGTPVDCVRLSVLDLIPGWRPDVVVSGINHGANLGDDVTYSGTVAAASEGLLLGVAGVAVSQEPLAGSLGVRHGQEFDFTVAAAFTARVVGELDDIPLPPATLLNINVPGRTPTGVEVARLGRRVYRDQLEPHADDDAAAAPHEPRRYFVYTAEPGFEDEPGTDLNAVHAGRIAVTPLHLELTRHEGLAALSEARLERLLTPVARER
ncbi:MAG: surE [Solirubrobacterales bacterium]|nr:surE [Solirubrobacterales bacterium]